MKIGANGINQRHFNSQNSIKPSISTPLPKYRNKIHCTSIYEVTLYLNSRKICFEKKVKYSTSIDVHHFSKRNLYVVLN